MKVQRIINFPSSVCLNAPTPFAKGNERSEEARREEEEDSLISGTDSEERVERSVAGRIKMRKVRERERKEGMGEEGGREID